MEFKELQEKIKRKYYEIDKKSEDLFLLSVLFEEVGELAEAVRKGNKDKISVELADVIFITLSLANYFKIDNLEEIIVQKYIEDDPSSKWDLRY